MPSNDIGIDLGTTNSLVYSTGRGLVLSEPSVVVYDKDTEKIKAIGEEARQMAGHVTSNMEVICPIRQGMIIDFVVMEKMLKYFIAKAMGRRAFRKPRISVCVPSGITEIERKAVEEATYQAGAREVFLVEEPIAAAIGSSIMDTSRAPACRVASSTAFLSTWVTPLGTQTAIRGFRNAFRPIAF